MTHPSLINIDNCEDECNCAGCDFWRKFFRIEDEYVASLREEFAPSDSVIDPTA